MANPFANIDAMNWREVAQDLADIVVPRWRVERLPIVASAAAQDMSMVLAAGSVILPGAFIYVATAEVTGTTKTVDIGISGGDEDGILDGVSVAATGTIIGKPTFTVGSNETYYASSTVGVLVATKLAGSNLATDVGTYHEAPYVCTAATTICYTLGSNNFAELFAHLYLPVLELP